MCVIKTSVYACLGIAVCSALGAVMLAILGAANTFGLTHADVAIASRSLIYNALAWLSIGAIVFVVLLFKSTEK